MYCKNCGSEIPETAKFCPVCGTIAPIEEYPQTPAANAFKKTKVFFGAKKKYIIAAAVILVVLITGIALFINFALPKLEASAEINDLGKQIKNREYKDAFRSYEEFDSENRTKANKWLREYIDSVEEDYYEGKLDYPTATGILSELLPFEAVSSKISKASENIHLDNQSTMAFEKAKDYAEDKKWQDAYKALQNINIKYRLYDDVADLRTECLENYRKDVLDQISDFAKNEKIDKLIAVRDSALKVIPDDKEIIKVSQEHLDKFVKDTLADAAALAQKEDYANAIELLQYAADMYDHEDLWDALNGYGYDAAEAHCEALVAKNDLAGAVKYAKGLAANDTKYNALLLMYAKPFVQETLNSAKEYADKRQYTDAITKISKAQVIYDCDEFVAAAENYGLYVPRKIAECHIIDSEDAIIGGSAQDCFGVTYENILAFDESYSGNTKGGFATFNLGGKFVNLKGIFVGSNELYKDMTVSCTIYADEKLLYESAELGRTSEPVNINLDITGVNQLRIEYMWYSWWTHDACCIFDLTVS